MTSIFIVPGGNGTFWRWCCSLLGYSPAWKEVELEPWDCELWLTSLEDSRVWLAASPRRLLLPNILHMGCSSRTPRPDVLGWRFGHFLRMLKLQAEHQDYFAMVPPTIRGCSTWFLYEFPVYDSQGPHGKGLKSSLNEKDLSLFIEEKSWVRVLKTVVGGSPLPRVTRNVYKSVGHDAMIDRGLDSYGD
ncbi:hypothetical protein TIFTF001_049141 [Ficus carica]|uniref:Uncharacterized protein n=1 Tax=Ficus carica TaxID=3494 RepID=A0AA87Z2L4_FICCA|nr:hypothetical protein TIFTF001_049135 [Ficus carica]GMN24435.1 hypothetical protein TIFTF001_049137 [Ficus carica]GMN24454.1 hypothetical protein TIFTF001_049139 [Ficus carica]GMN24476.1 hypothetical protein TIFTF001_049141 [Ficus carica]